jgi:hypothetical protein
MHLRLRFRTIRIRISAKSGEARNRISLPASGQPSRLMGVVVLDEGMLHRRVASALYRRRAIALRRACKHGDQRETEVLASMADECTQIAQVLEAFDDANRAANAP